VLDPRRRRRLPVPARVRAPPSRYSQSHCSHVPSTVPTRCRSGAAPAIDHAPRQMRKPPAQPCRQRAIRA
jgi:hypothetical protein